MAGQVHPGDSDRNEAREGAKTRPPLSRYARSMPAEPAVERPPKADDELPAPTASAAAEPAEGAAPTSRAASVPEAVSEASAPPVAEAEPGPTPVERAEQAAEPRDASVVDSEPGAATAVPESPPAAIVDAREGEAADAPGANGTEAVIPGGTVSLAAAIARAGVEPQTSPPEAPADAAPAPDPRDAADPQPRRDAEATHATEPDPATGAETSPADEQPTPASARTSELGHDTAARTVEPDVRRVEAAEVHDPAPPDGAWTQSVVPVKSAPDAEAGRAKKVPFWKRIALPRSPAGAAQASPAAAAEPVLARLGALEKQLAANQSATETQLARFEENITRLWETEDQMALTEMRERLALLEANQQEIADGLHTVGRNLTLVALVLAVGIAAGLLALGLLL